MSREQKPKAPDENRDPISGEPGAHPIGVGTGTAVGGTAGGAAVGGLAAAAAAGGIAGSVVGPVGTAIGTAVGVVAGGIAGAYAGKSIAEKVNPTEEDQYWRRNYRSRPYVNPDASYEEYQTAYRYGWETRAQHAGRSFDEAEAELRKHWGSNKSKLEWKNAGPAVRDAWDRIDKNCSEVGPGNNRILEDPQP
jgi:hypothetical protein